MPSFRCLGEIQLGTDRRWVAVWIAQGEESGMKEHISKALGTDDTTRNGCSQVSYTVLGSFTLIALFLPRLLKFNLLMGF